MPVKSFLGIVMIVAVAMAQNYDNGQGREQSITIGILRHTLAITINDCRRDIDDLLRKLEDNNDIEFEVDFSPIQPTLDTIDGTFYSLTPDPNANKMNVRFHFDIIGQELPFKKHKNGTGCTALIPFSIFADGKEFVMVANPSDETRARYLSNLYANEMFKRLERRSIGTLLNGKMINLCEGDSCIAGVLQLEKVVPQKKEGNSLKKS